MKNTILQNRNAAGVHKALAIAMLSYISKAYAYHLTTDKALAAILFGIVVYPTNINLMTNKLFSHASYDA